MIDTNMRKFLRALFIGYPAEKHEEIYLAYVQSNRQCSLSERVTLGEIPFGSFLPRYSTRKL